MTGRAAAVLAQIPSPTQGVWHLGPIPIRAYALCIIAGIVLAVWLGNKRYVARGGQDGVVLDVAAWAVPFGIVGGRLYHVATSWQLYFAKGAKPIDALYIWHGGLGIWGAIALGAVGALIGARRRGILMPPLADALAPGILAAQALGRWGNYFNNELYGGHTNLPWGLKVYDWDLSAGHAVMRDGRPVVTPGGPFHPTFLYESVWSAVGVAVLLWADRRFKLGHGRVFALYVAIYTSGRLWIEALRVDPANTILGLRLNVWTSIIVLVCAVVAFVVLSRRYPGREVVVTRPGPVVSIGPKDVEVGDDGDDSDDSDDADSDEEKDAGAKRDAEDGEAEDAAKDSDAEDAAKDSDAEDAAKDSDAEDAGGDDGGSAPAAGPEPSPTATA